MNMLVAITVDRLKEIAAYQPGAHVVLGGWADHQGGGRPHAPHIDVEVQTRSGGTLCACSAMLRWPWTNEPRDILKYRRIRFIEAATPDEQNALARAAIVARGPAETSGEQVALKAALRMMACPRPFNDRPDDFEVGHCVDAGECGCVAGKALSPTTSQAGALSRVQQDE